MPYRSFQRRSTGQALEPVMGGHPRFSVDASAHAQNVADGYGFPVDDIMVIETVDPPVVKDALPVPPPVLTPKEQERLFAHREKLPSGDDITTLVESVFADHTEAQRRTLARLARLVRVLVEVHGL